MILKCFHQRLDFFVVSINFKMCVTNDHLFLYFIPNFNQGEDQGPVTAVSYKVSKIIDHAFVDSLSNAEKMPFLEKSWRPPPNSILDK